MYSKKNVSISLIAILLWTFSWSSEGRESIKIAVVFARTGIASLEGLDFFLANYLAVENINNRGGILGRPLEVVDLDNKSSALGAKAAAQKAVELNVTAVIGAEWSTYSLAMAAVLQEACIPMITPLSTNPKITQTGDYIFRVCFTDELQGKAIALFIQDDLKAKNAVIIKNVNSDYSLGLAESFRRNFEQTGKRIIWEGNYEEKQVDFTDILKKLKALNTDIIFLPGNEKGGGPIIKKAREMGISTPFFGCDGWTDRIYESGGAAVEGCYATTLWHPDSTDGRVKQIQKEYLRKYGKKLASDQVLVYDAVMLLADAISRAGAVDRKKIRDALAATDKFNGITGTISFDSHGDPKGKKIAIVKYEKGGRSLVKRIGL